MTSARFSIDVDPVGYSSIEVNGEDVTDKVHGFRTESVQGQPTVLTLYHSGQGTIEGEGIVQVEVIPDLFGDQIAEWLSNIDVDVWEKAALARSEWGNGDLKVLMLDVLRDWAQGKP